MSEPFLRISQPGGVIQLTARPRDGGPDPSDPELQEAAFVRYKLNGKVSSVPLWRALELLADPYRNWEQATLDEFKEWEALQVEADNRSLETGRPVTYWHLMQLKKTGQDTPQAVSQPVTAAHQDNPEPTADPVLTAIESMNQKFDTLTDAILQLASHSNPKKKG